MTAARAAPAGRGIVAALSPRALATVAELVAVVLAVRLLGVTLYGTYQTAAVAGGLGALALDLSRQTTGTAALAAGPSVAVYARLSRPRRLSAAALGLAALAAYLVGWTWPGAGLAVATATMVEQRWAMLAAHRPVALGASYLARPVASIVTVVAGSVLGAPHRTLAAYALPVAAAVGGTAVAVLDGALARRLLPSADRPESRQPPWRPRLSLTVAALLASAYVSGDLLLVRGLSGAQQAGIYALAYKPVTALLVLVALLRDLWIADLSRERPRLTGGVLTAALGAAIVAAALAAVVLVAHPLRLATGVDHADTVTALLLLSVVPIVMSSWYYARAVSWGRLTAPLPAVAVALVVDVAANAALVPSLGAKGGALATLAAEVVSTAAAAWVLYRPTRPGRG